jgi:hypothetical protein
MTEALKTDWLEQAKREIDEEQPPENSPALLRAALFHERARNLELRGLIDTPLRLKVAEFLGCEPEELDSCDPLLWLTWKVNQGRGPITFCSTEDGDIGVFDSTEESAKAIGIGDTAEQAIVAAMKKVSHERD